MSENYPRKYWWFVLVVVPIMVALVQIFPDLMRKKPQTVTQSPTGASELESGTSDRRLPQKVTSPSEIPLKADKRDSTVPPNISAENSSRRSTGNSEQLASPRGQESARPEPKGQGSTQKEPPRPVKESASGAQPGPPRDPRPLPPRRTMILSSL